jgi:PEP-CTERM motif
MAVIAAFAFTFLARPAHADTLQSYSLAWSGASFGDGVAVTGSMTLDLTTLPNPTNYVDIYNDITSLSITVSGSGTGDGTYTKSDLCLCNDTRTSYTYWNTNGNTINMTGNVLSQLNGVNGDFNLFFAAPGPVGTGVLVLTMNGGSGLPAAMTQFKPVTTTPEPASLALMLGGLSVLGLAVLRKRGLASML